MKKEIAVKGKFKTPFMDNVYEGYHFTGPADTFNGYDQPLFTPGEAHRIMTDLAELFGRYEKIETEDGERRLCYIGGQTLKWMKL